MKWNGGSGFCIELRHPKEGHFNNSLIAMTPAFHSAHQVGGPHSSYCFLGSARCKGECKVFRTGGVYIVHIYARVETANAKAKSFSSCSSGPFPPFKKRSKPALSPSIMPYCYKCALVGYVKENMGTWAHLHHILRKPKVLLAWIQIKQRQQRQKIQTMRALASTL
jgi:hypothetical protein